MWRIVQSAIPALLVVIFLSQYIIPILMDKRTWWLFRGEKKKSSDQLSDEIEKTKSIVDEASAKAGEVIEKAGVNLKEAEDLKKTADKLKK